MPTDREYMISTETNRIRDFALKLYHDALKHTIQNGHNDYIACSRLETISLKGPHWYNVNQLPSDIIDFRKTAL